MVKDLPNQSKKKKKKEPITKRDTKSITDVNKNTKEETGMVHSLQLNLSALDWSPLEVIERTIKDQQNEAEVTDIVALSSHKTHSTPVDPIELKKRLVDLLIQRTTKGDQQALKLKVSGQF